MINYLIESLKHPIGRFQSLTGITSLLTDSEPVVNVRPDYCDAAMIHNGREVRMRCYFRADKMRTARLSEVASFLSALGTGLYTGFGYYPAELLVFDDSGAHRRLDVSIEEKGAGVTLREYLQSPVSPDALANLTGEVISLARRHAPNNLYHGRLSADCIFVDGDGKLSIGGLDNASRCDTAGDLSTLGRIASILALAIADARVLGLIERYGDDTIRVVCDAVVESELSWPLKTILDAVRAEGSGEVYNASKAALLELIDPRAITPDSSFSGALDRLTGRPAGTPHETESSAVGQKKTYEFIGQRCDMMMRAWDGHSWCYINRDGETVIPGPFLDAADFMEGLAVVETEKGYGLIDREGEFVLEPGWDDIEIDESSNRIIVTRDGYSALVSRSGEQITGLVYDHIIASCEQIFVVKQGRYYGYIDRDGRPLTDIIYEEAESFEQGRAKVTYKGRSFVIGPDGKTIGEILKKD